MKIAIDERTNKVGNAIIQVAFGCDDGAAHEFPIETWTHRITPDMRVREVNQAELITLKNTLRMSA